MHDNVSNIICYIYVVMTKWKVYSLMTNERRESIARGVWNHTCIKYIYTSYLPIIASISLSLIKSHDFLPSSSSSKIKSHDLLLDFMSGRRYEDLKSPYVFLSTVYYGWWPIGSLSDTVYVCMSIVVTISHSCLGIWYHRISANQAAKCYHTDEGRKFLAGYIIMTESRNPVWQNGQLRSTSKHVDQLSYCDGCSAS
jgi:preprotein translocase subunit SecY